MKTTCIEVKKGGNVRVKIYVTTRTKNGQAYAEYKVADYFTFPGKRKLWAFAKEDDAREKANEIAESITTGQGESTFLTEFQKRELTESVDLLRPYGIDLKMAVSLFCEAIDIIGGQPGHLRIAAQFYKTNRPDKPFEEKRADDAVTEFLAAQKETVCQHRHESLTCYLDQFLKDYSGRKLHEVKQHDVEAFLEKKKNWSPKTTNDFLGMIGLLYKFAQKGSRNWVPAGYNPAKEIDRQPTCEGEIELMEPDEAKRMFQQIDPDLIPFLVLWCFTGCRKEEAARVTWQQISSGHLVLDALRFRERFFVYINGQLGVLATGVKYWSIGEIHRLIEANWLIVRRFKILEKLYFERESEQLAQGGSRLVGTHRDLQTVIHEKRQLGNLVAGR